jgi:hypothetical protein
MTDFRGVNNTLAFSDVPSQKIPAGEQAGRLRVAYDEYDLADSAALDTTDVIKFMEIPAGARIHEVILVHPDVGTTGDANLGWAASADGGETADPNGFLAAVDLNAAAGSHLMSSQLGVPGKGKEFSEAVEVQLVPTEIFTAVVGIIKVTILYTLD